MSRARLHDVGIEGTVRGRLRLEDTLMIQFRWEPCTHVPEKGTATIKIDGVYCILQYRIHFVPAVNWNLDKPDGVIVLQAARDVDAEWKNVEINWGS